MITLKRFNGALVTPKDDAILFDHLVDDSGILEGISVSHLGANQLLVAAGRGIIKGRDFTVEEETLLAQLSPSGAQKGRLLIRLDISNVETPVSFVTQVATTLPNLVQEDINRDGTIYELSLATYDVSELLISNLVFVGKMLQPLKGKLADHVDNGDIHLTPSEKTKVLGGSNVWMAASCTYRWDGYNHIYDLTIPNFVFTIGTTVVIPQMPKDNGNGIGAYYICIGGVTYYQIMRAGEAKPVGVTTELWVENTPVMLVLSNYQSGANRTAFFYGAPNSLLLTSDIPASSDLNNYKKVGTYVCTQDTTAATIANCPSAHAFKLTVEALLPGNFYKQTVVDYYNGVTYTRVFISYGSQWKPWEVNAVNVFNALAGTTDFSFYPVNSFIFVRR